MKWIVTANTNNCRIYDYHKKPHELKLIEEINFPENKLKTSELVSDKPGRYKTSGEARGTYVQASDPEKVLIDNFARVLAHKLDEARNQHDYDELVFIMPSDMDGLVCHHLNRNVKGMIKKNIQKNIMHLTEKELLDYLDDNLN